MAFASLLWLEWILGLGPRPPLRWLRQPNAVSCSHTAVALVAHISMRSVFERAPGHSALSVSRAVQVLKDLGYPTRPVHTRVALACWDLYRARAGGRKLSGIGFMLPGSSDAIGHAVVLFGRRIYDPADGSFRALEKRTLERLDWIALL